MKFAVLKAGLAKQGYRKEQDMLLIFSYGTVAPSDLNQDLSIS